MTKQEIKQESLQRVWPLTNDKREDMSITSLSDKDQQCSIEIEQELPNQTTNS